MLTLICHIVLGGALIAAFYQDWKYRAVHWSVFVALAAASVGYFTQLGFPLELILTNLCFVGAVVGLTFVYFSIKAGKWVNLFQTQLGLGDVLFFIAITPLFAGRNYMLFFITGMFLAALTHLVVQQVKQVKTIPLAGYLAIYLLGLKALNYYTPTDLFYHQLF